MASWFSPKPIIRNEDIVANPGAGIALMGFEKRHLRIEFES